MTGPTGWPLPDPARLDPPPGDPAALAGLATRLDSAAAFLGDLEGRLGGAPAAACGWTGDDAGAADTQVARVGDLARSAADALVCAAARVRRHEEVLTDVRQRLAQLRRAQAEDFDAAVARMGAAADPATGLPGPAAAAAIEELQAAEATRGRLHATVLAGVEEDAAATAGVLVACSAVAGDGGAADGASAVRYLEDLLPGWHARVLGQRGADFAAAFRSGELVDREQAARALLPWAGNGAVAAAVLTGLGAEGVQEVLRLLGDGSLSAGSALAQVMAAVLGAPLPTGAAGEVARVRDARHIDPDDVRSLDADHVALGMGAVLAAARQRGLAGPPVATVREWGWQIIRRERALGAGWITSSRAQAVAWRHGDPLVEVLDRLARADGGAQAARLLGGEPTWSHLLSRSWDDDGAAFAAVVERAAGEPGRDGDLVVRSGLRALGTGLADDGDPAGWTVDRSTATSVAPALADAVVARPEVVAGSLVRAAAGQGDADRVVLRGLGYLGTDPAAAAVLDRGVTDAAARVEAPAAVLLAGYAAVREYGVELAHALEEFAAQERAEYREGITGVVDEVLGYVRGPVSGVASRVLPVVAVAADLDGTWDASVDDGRHVSSEDAVRAAGGSLEAELAYHRVKGVMGDPTAPLPPPTDWLGLAVDLMPGAEVVLEVAGEVNDVVTEMNQR